MAQREDYFKKSIENIEDNLKTIINGDEWMCSCEIVQEFVHIINRLEQLRLDHDILQSSSEWSAQHDIQTLDNNKQDVVKILSEANNFLKQYREKFSKDRLANLQENQRRERHEWAMLNLSSIEKELDPYIVAAYKRIHSFGDHTGVTDRFNGYRQNLTRGSTQPCIYDPSWMRNKRTKLFSNEANDVLFGHHPERLRNQLLLPPVSYEAPILSMGCAPAYRNCDVAPQESDPCSEGGPIERLNAVVEKKSGILGTTLRIGDTLPPELVTRGYLTIDSLYPQGTVKYNENLPSNSQVMHNARYEPVPNETLDKIKKAMSCPTDSDKSRYQPQDLLTIQRAAGLEPLPNYNTEYSNNFIKPPIDFPGGNFVVNPAPNLTVNDRPTAPVVYESTNTEYQTRYLWPDTTNMHKMTCLKS